MINEDCLKLGKSIQPILTKCDPSDQDFDIEVVRSTLMLQL